MDWREQRQTRSEAETEAGATDVMTTYPDDGRVRADRRSSPRSPSMSPISPLAADGFDRELEEIATSEEDAIAGAEPGAEAEQVALTPMGTARGVTTSDEIDYRPPPAKALRAGQGRQGARPARPGSRRAQAGRDARPLRGRGEDRRRRQRPARLPLRAAPGARDQGRRKSPSWPTTSPTPSPRPTSASSPRSPASRRSGSRSRTRAAASSASATSTPAARRRPRRWSPGSARASTATRSGPTWRRCRTCSSPAPPARASPAASTRSSPRS